MGTISLRIKPFLFFLLLMQGGLCLHAQAEWAKQFGGAEGESVSGLACVSSGKLFTIGTFTGTSIFENNTLASAGKGDVFLMKADAITGGVEWVKQLGSGGEDNGNALTCDTSGNIYGAGRFNGTVVFGNYTLTATGNQDAFVMRIDPATGAVVWAQKMGGTGVDGGLSLACDNNGNVFVSGYFQGTAVFGTNTISPAGTNQNMFVAKCDVANGNVNWVKGFGNAGYTYATSVDTDLSGNVYVTGSFESELVVGTDTLKAMQYQDAFIIKLDAGNGNPLWSVEMGGAANDSGSGIDIGTDGQVYTTGRFESTAVFGTTTLTADGSSDVFVCKVNAANGAITWIKKFGSQGYEQCNAITHNAAGNIFITGQFNGIADFGNFSLVTSGNADVFVARINAVTGDVTWAGHMGGTMTDAGYGFAGDATNGLYVTGTFQGNADFENFNFTSKGGTDVFLVKLNSLTVGWDEKELREDLFQVMPVPCHDELNILIEGQSTERSSLVLRDMLGKPVMEGYGMTGHSQWNVSALNPGIYFLYYQDGRGKTAVKKIVKN